MSERFKEPVLKTGDPATGRGFESHSLRQNRQVILIEITCLFYFTYFSCCCIMGMVEEAQEYGEQ